MKKITFVILSALISYSFADQFLGPYCIDAIKNDNVNGIDKSQQSRLDARASYSQFRDNLYAEQLKNFMASVIKLMEVRPNKVNKTSTSDKTIINSVNILVVMKPLQAK